MFEILEECVVGLVQRRWVVGDNIHERAVRKDLNAVLKI